MGVAVRASWLRVAAVCVVGAICGARLGAATLPPDFSETVLTSALVRPTAMAIAPDGRVFVCEQGGQLRVIEDGTLLPTPFLSLTVSSSGERGLLGVALDPSFQTNGFVYVYYTATTPTIHNRVSRFTASGNVAIANSEVVLLDLETLSSATNHNGGALHFGADGKLYVAVGDNANGSHSQTLANRLGKVLRINPDGSIPTDNPFYAAATGANRAIWVLGLRNPFTFAVQPQSGRILINDVGQNTWEEVNDGIAGANYGWPTTEGPTTNLLFVSPLYAYQHDTGEPTGCAISGGAFYNPLVQDFPAHFVGTYFFADYCGGWIRSLDLGAEPAVSTAFASGIAWPVDLRVSDDGALYYLARGTSSTTGVLARITYAGSNGDPDLLISALKGKAGAGAGQPWSITETTANQGTATSGQSTTRFHLSTDKTLGPGDVVLGSRAVPALTPGSVSTAATTVSIPPGTAIGKYFALVEADADKVVPETSEANNLKAKTLYVGPDLRAAVSAPAEATRGTTVSITVTTTNAGGDPAAASTTRVYFSLDKKYDAADTLLKTLSVAALAAGGKQKDATTVTIPASTTVGTRYLIAVADATSVVVEAIEGNNAKARAITVE